MKRLTPVLLLALALGSCKTSKSVDVVPFLAPTETATLDDLVGYINQWNEVQSLVLRVDLQFQTVEEADEGLGRQYRTAQGRLLLQRPERIRLNIEAPILSANIAEMASNGERFQLLIHPPDYRALIEGRNDQSYEDETAKLDRGPRARESGPARQHPTTTLHRRLLVVRDPERGRQHGGVSRRRAHRRARHSRQGAKDGALVRKSYYVVTVARLGESSPRARYWFDRFGQIAMARQQVYGSDGRLVSDIRYSEYLPAQGDAGHPHRVAGPHRSAV